jgi:putative Mg2+ transporter-C (MgtC) family protein
VPEAWIDQLAVLGDMAVAMLLGGLVGYERELAGKPAGFRTHMLVAGAAALFVGLGHSLLASFDPGSDTLLRYDPIRVIEAVITGISFLGAGTIFRAKSDHVSGLTTAASLLVCGGIGIAVAADRYVVAIGATLLALLVLRSLAAVEGWVRPARPRDGGDAA